MIEYCPDCGGILTEVNSDRKDCPVCGRVWMKYFNSGWYAVGIYDGYIITFDDWAKFQDGFVSGVRKINETQKPS